MTHAQIATAWAVAALAQKGYTLHSVPAYGWDVEAPDGKWHAVNSWQELCKLAREVV